MSGLSHSTAEGAGLPRPYARWSRWLVAGMLAGLLAGFAVGLGRPRPRPGTVGSW